MATRSSTPAVELDVDGRTVRLTNPDRVYFPAHGWTKLDLAQYYLAVGPVSYTHLTLPTSDLV